MNLPGFFLTQPMRVVAVVLLVIASGRPAFAAALNDSTQAASPKEGAYALRLLNREALLFRNGDVLYGTLDSMEPQVGIRWRNPEASEVIEFRTDHVTEIQLTARPAGSTNAPNSCRVQLSNGDELQGRLAALDPEKLQLETWYAGDVTIPRTMIQSLIPMPPEGATVFHGPSGLEGWTVGKVVSALGDAGEWKYRNGAFYATNAASIARDVKLPDVAIIEFDLTWKGLFQLAIALYTDYFHPINLANKDTEPEFGGFYSLQLNSFSANVLPVKKNDPLRYLGQISVPAFNQKNQAHVEIRASKPKRTLSLLVDGQLIKQWVDTEDFAGQGKGVRFVHQGQGKVKIAGFRVSEWDGQFEEKPVVNPDSKQDVVKLRNGDKAGGIIDSIRDGVISVSTSGTTLDIPLARVKMIEFAGQKTLRPTTDQGDIRAVFTKGGAVTFQLEKWDAGQLRGTSPNFGKLAFDATAFSRVELKARPAAP